MSMQTRRSLCEGPKRHGLPEKIKSIAWMLNMECTLRVKKSRGRESIRIQVRSDGERHLEFERLVTEAVEDSNKEDRK